MHKWLYERPGDQFHTDVKTLEEKNFHNCFFLLDIQYCISEISLGT